MKQAITKTQGRILISNTLDSELLTPLSKAKSRSTGNFELVPLVLFKHLIWSKYPL